MATSQTDRLYSLLSQRIKTAAIKPGTLLVEPEIAAEYGVSRTPARETLRLLVAEGWLQVMPRKGYIVAPLQLQDVSDIMELRVLLEPQLSALAAVNATAEMISELQTLIEQQHAPTADRSTQIERAQDFHLLLAAASSNARAANVLSPLVAEITRLHYAVPKFAGHISSEKERQAHGDIVDALAARDAAAAERLMRAHLEESRTAMFAGF